MATGDADVAKLLNLDVIARKTQITSEDLRERLISQTATYRAALVDAVLAALRVRLKTLDPEVGQ
jgi:DNA-binding phage protein